MSGQGKKKRRLEDTDISVNINNDNPSKKRKLKESTLRKADCAAILISSTNSTNSNLNNDKEIVPRTKCDETSQPIDFAADIANMQSTFIRSRGIDIVKTFEQKVDKNEVIESIKDLFADIDRKSFVLYYSGNARLLTGDWCFEQKQFICLCDILQIYKNRQIKNKKKKVQKLIIISDCSYSGAWIKELRKMKVSNVWMQASCQEDNVCTVGKYGGVFTTKYVNNSLMLSSKQKQSNWLWIGGVFGAMIGGVTMFIKDAVIMALYEMATKQFEPMLYSSDGFKTVIVGKHINGFDDVCIRLFSSWHNMNKRNTAQTMLGWTVGNRSI